MKYTMNSAKTRKFRVFPEIDFGYLCIDICQDRRYAISTASNILQTLCEKMSCPVGAAAGLIKLKRCSNEKQHEKNYARTPKGQVACEKQDRHNHNRVQRRADRASAKAVRR